MAETLNEKEKECLRALLEKADWRDALAHTLELEARGWKVRLANEAYNPTELDPVRSLLKQCQLATRAKQLDEIIGILRKRATE